MSERSIRKRITPYAYHQGSFLEEGTTNGVVWTVRSNINGSRVDRGTQITESEGHPVSRLKADGMDIGGEFYTMRQVNGPLGKKAKPSLPKIWDIKAQTPARRYRYQGPLFPIGPTEYPPDLSTSTQDLWELGTTAIARCKPTNSPADLSVTLGELISEGLPSLIGVEAFRRRNPSAFAGEYLNYVFGWQPLVSSVKDVIKVVSDFEKYMTQYERDAGRPVRRGYTFPTVIEEQLPVVVNSFAAPRWAASDGFLNSQLISSLGVLTRTRKITREQWFSGCFTYHLPRDYQSRSKVEKHAFAVQKILGLELTPEVVWNLAPWSWAIDWVANAGDVISNVTDYLQDGFVMRYGYMMETTTVTDTYTLLGFAAKNQQTSPPLKTALSTIVKKRVKASPFGFGLTYDGFDDRQKSIIAALAISQSGRR